MRVLAPALPGSVLAGPGEASAVLALDGAEMAAVLAGDPAGDAFAASLQADVVLAFTRGVDLVAALRRHAPRLVAQDPDPPPGIHAARWLAEPVATLGADPTIAAPTLAFTEDERHVANDHASGLPRGFLVVHPGSGSSRKNWPPDRFVELVERRAASERWLLVQGPADEAAAAPLRRRPGAVVADRLPPRLLGALVSRAGLFVGNDSGVTHLAAAAGAPTLALFGPTDATTWAPLGPTVETVCSPDGTMAGLDVDRVEDAAHRLLGRTTSRS